MIYIAILIVLLAVAGFLYYGYYKMQYEAQQWKYKIKFDQYLFIRFSPIPEKKLLKILAFSQTLGQTIPIKTLNMYYHFEVDIEAAFEAFKIIHKAGISISAKKEEDFQKVLHFTLKGKDTEGLSYAMLKAADSNISLNIDDLLNHINAKGNIKKAVELIVEARNVGMDISINELTEHLNKGGKLDNEIDVKINLRRANYDISLNDIRRFALERDVKLLVKILIKAKNNNLSLSVDELLAFPNNLDLEQAVDVLIELHRAGIKINLKELELYSHVRDMKELINVMALISSQSFELNISFDHIKAFPVQGNIETAISLLIKAHQADITDLSLNDLSMHITVGGDIEKFVIALMNAKEENLDITLNDLKEFYQVSKNGNGPDLLRAVELLIIARSHNISLKLKDLRRHIAERGDVEKLVQALLISEHENLGVTLLDLENHFRQGGDVEQFVVALRISKQEDFGYTKETLLKLHNKSAHVLSLIRALRVNKREDLKIEQSEIEKIYNEGLDVLKIVYALINASHSGLNIAFDYAVAIERSNVDIEEAIKWGVHPRTLEVPIFRVVAKDGIEMSLKPQVKVRGKMTQYFGGAREDVAFDRVKAAVTNEMVLYKSHLEIRENRDKIARDAYKLIASEEHFNKNSALEILDILIPEIVPENDTNSKLKMEIAEMEKQLAEYDAETRRMMLPILEKEAQIKEINERADKEKNIGIAFKEGTITTNEYYKYKTNEK